MGRFDSIAHVKLQEILHGVNTQHHHQACQKHPGKIGVAPRIEVEQPQDANGGDHLKNDLLHISANRYIGDAQRIP